MIAASFADFSLSELMRLLCFESEDQAANFLRAYSLKVSDTGQVRFVPCSRDSFFFASVGCRQKQKARRMWTRYVHCNCLGQHSPFCGGFSVLSTLSGRHEIKYSNSLFVLSRPPKLCTLCAVGYVPSVPLVFAGGIGPPTPVYTHSAAAWLGLKPPFLLRFICNSCTPANWCRTSTVGAS